MKTFISILLLGTILLTQSFSVHAVNSPQCLLQDQSQMETCENVETEVLGFTIPTLGNVLTFVLRAFFVAAGLAGLFYLLTGALMFQRGDSDSKEQALSQMRAAVIGILLTVGILSVVWTLEQVVFKRRICLGLTCPIALQSILKTTDSLDCCICLISKGPKSGQPGEVINRYEQSCTDDGLGVDLAVSVRQAQAQKIADDMVYIRGKLLLWKSGPPSFNEFPHESVFVSQITEKNPDAVCHDDPLFTEILKLTTLNRNLATYLPSVPEDPFGVGYVYDNDGNRNSPNKNARVNVFLQWCTENEARYLDLAPDIDKIIDNGNGPDVGPFMWDKGTKGAGNYILRVSDY